ncbi:MAG TPA: hypothetical protein VIY48_02110, partial [Candidatus Paceibacterota bacterium]
MLAYEPGLGPAYRPSIAATAAVNTPTNTNVENGSPSSRATAPSAATASLVPDAGVYAQGQAAANKAYQDAVATLLSKKNSSYHSAGLTSDAKVDPLNQYGEYQQMLGSQGQQLDLAHDSSVARGLGAGGLANQAESALRPGFNADNLRFQQGVDAIGQDYTAGVQSAEAQRTAAMQQALKDAIDRAIQNSWFTPYDPGAPADSGGGGSSDSGGGGGSTGTAALARTVAAAKKYNPSGYVYSSAPSKAAT